MAAVVRRVVFSETESGKAVIARDETVDPVLGSIAYYGVWGWNEPPTLPASLPDEYDQDGVFPPPGGLRVNLVEFPPAAHRATSAEIEAGEAEWQRLRKANPAHVEDGGELGAFVKTDSVDIGFVLSGEIDVEADDGVKTTLRPGDVYVQYGARHSWANRGDEPCLVGWVVVPASRA